MSTVIVPAVNKIAVDNRSPVPLLAAFLVALGCQVRKAIRAVSDLLERRFSEFAGVPYQSQVDRQQWEDLWETESRTRTAADRGWSSQEGNAIYFELLNQFRVRARQ